MSVHISRKETAEFWDQRWAAGQRQWDHGRASPVFGEFVERHGVPAGKVLIPGAGSGHDVLYFASLGARVTGLDVSPTAVRIAREENPHVNASYVTANFLQPDPGQVGKYDWVMEHACLCSMKPVLWGEYAKALRQYLKPGGNFLAIFYKNPASTEGPPYRIDNQAIEDLFGAGFSQLASWIPEKSYASRAGREEVRWFRLRSETPDLPSNEKED